MMTQRGQHARPWRKLSLVGTGLLALATTACTPLTQEEAEEALEEARLHSQALTLIGNTVELSENFSIGQAVEDSIENLHDFYSSQLPCAELTLEEGWLLVDFGAKGDSCQHLGMRFSGRQAVNISLNEENDVIVQHEWTDLENGEIKLNGTATVTWSGADDPSREVIHELAWERLSDGRSAEGSGEQVQRPLGGDLSRGFEVTGASSWRGESGLWELEIDQVQMRWIDPVPEAGQYHLQTPFEDKSLTLGFTRASTRKVVVKATSGYREYSIDVLTPE